MPDMWGTHAKMQRSLRLCQARASSNAHWLLQEDHHGSTGYLQSMEYA